MAKILIVDDEPEIRSLLQVLLTKKGYEVVIGSSGEDALEVMTNDTSIDLAVMDDRMPGVNGSEVIKEVKEKGIKVPIIMLTGSIVAASKDIPADAFLRKPIDLNELMEKVAEILEG